MSVDKRCQTCGRKPPRSNPQNNRLHKLFTLLQDNVTSKEDNLFHHREWWKVRLKDKYLGYNEYINEAGKEECRLKSTAELTVEEFNEFMAKVERYCAIRGVYLQDGD